MFVDECGTNTSLSPMYAYYSLKGRRAYAQVPRNRGANTTLLASMSLEGMDPCLTVEGTTTTLVFEAYVEQVLAPSLKRGQRSWWWTTSALTRARGPGNWSKNEVANYYSTCQRIRRTLIPLRKLSRRSRVPYEKHKPEHAKP